MLAVKMEPCADFDMYEEHHRKLFGMLSKLDDVIADSEAGNAALYEVIDNLIIYAKSDLGREEETMAQIGFPGYQDHRMEHEAFRSNVDAYLSLMQFGCLPPATSVLDFLENWVVGHMITGDKEYILFLQGREGNATSH